MLLRKILRCSLFGAAVVTVGAGVLPLAPLAPSAADPDPCPDVEVIFARGTGEPAGLGVVGQAFVDALAAKLGGRTMDAYAVNYPADFDFLAADEGANDAAARIVAMGSRCQNTKLVLGGYSQGAAVIDMLASVGPLGATVGEIGSAPPLAAPFAEKISAVAVFGNPATRFGTPLSTTGLFAGRAIDLCNPDDPICSPTGGSRAAHNAYEFPPSNEEAAGFVAGLV